MHNTVDEKFQVSPSFLFYLVHAGQVGVGILGYQRYIIRGAGHDAWISTIISGISISILIWMCFHFLKRENTDVTHIHKMYFGKFLGSIFNLTLAVYFFIFALTVYRNYIEVLQVWMFPQISTWFMSCLFLPLIYYILTGGFRIITGIAFFGLILPLPLILSLIFPIQYGQVENLLPILDHGARDLFESCKIVTFEYLGFEALLVYYPFIKNGHSNQKWAHYGVMFSTFMYTIVAVISFMYFSQGQLSQSIWSTLTMAKIIEIPFIQRFEYVVISLWLLVVLPVITINAWCTVRIIKNQFGGRPSIYVLLLIIGLFACSLALDNRKVIDEWNNNMSKIGMYLIYFYIPLLFLFGLIRSKIKKARERHS
ncbi:GerAB/ArcD/ProY family transporter [Metabacillus iocasae]|uniref:Spore germination protein (Amino acid permease) n=1 Tax=Priestia iocasae TaxID=2291674 RepID=A0ABS2QSP1_9BACI|nr:GerAB/ArcD/ProY family transporter [Metabacillus iocasae]MBM7702228.1 spore germination protein (amino acid permease) [Metabacillus iocasae]